MVRNVCLGVFLTLAAAPLCAQEWAAKMFEGPTVHDFGTVAAGAKAEYEFVFKNLYLEDIHIAGVTASCGCTTPFVKNSRDTLKTYEKSAIVARFNTDRFQGDRGATLTVYIDRPFSAVVQLQVKGYIRRDVVFNPGSVQFGNVEQGTAIEKTVAVNYAGRSDWRIVDLKSSNPHIKAEVTPVSTNGPYINYNLRVRLDKDAPTGYLRDHIVLVTNDYRLQQVPVAIEGVVQSGITVNPGTLFMGVVKPGEKVTKKLVITGKKPFKVLSITSDGKAFEFDTAGLNEARPVHIVPVTFTAGEENGKVAKTIRIVTDLGDTKPELTAYAMVSAQQ
jgi:hypothetical protein